MFIAVEGIDGSGKETHSKLLNRWIKEKGRDTFLTKEPTDKAIGKLLRAGLKKGGLDPKTEALLFAADRAEHLREISPKIAEGKIVITERYLFSSMAYQGASGLDVEWIKEINSFAPLPDLVIYLDIPPDVAVKRISTKNSLRSAMREREYFERKEFLEKVRAIYLDLASKYKTFVIIDATKPIDEAQSAIRRKVGRALSSHGEKEKKMSQKELGEYIS